MQITVVAQFGSARAKVRLSYVAFRTFKVRGFDFQFHFG